MSEFCHGYVGELAALNDIDDLVIEGDAELDFNGVLLWKVEEACEFFGVLSGDRCSRFHEVALSGVFGRGGSLVVGFSCSSL